MAKNNFFKPKKSEKKGFFKKEDKDTLKKQELEKKNEEIERIEKEKFEQVEAEKQRIKKMELEKAEAETDKELLEIQHFIDKNFTEDDLKKMSFLEKRKFLDDAKK